METFEEKHNEREGDTAGRGETAVCHLCGQTFPTQEELSKHLMDVHPDEGLPEASDEA